MARGFRREIPKEPHTLDYFRKLLQYDPDTGLFHWKIRVGTRGAAGAVAGTPNPNGYLKSPIDKKQYSLHRLAWFFSTGAWPKGQIDHINGDRQDNRIANLRDVDQSANLLNSHKHRKNPMLENTQKLSNGRYAARIRRRVIGYFDTREEAHRFAAAHMNES